MLTLKVFGVLLLSLFSFALVSASKSKHFSLVPADSLMECSLCYSHLAQNGLYREGCDHGYHPRCLQESFVNKMETDQLYACQNCQECKTSDNYYAFLTFTIFVAPELPQEIIYIPGILEAHRLSTMWAKAVSSSTRIPLNRATKIGFPTTGMELKGRPINFMTVIAVNATTDNLNAVLDSGVIDSTTTENGITRGFITAICNSKFENASILLSRGANINEVYGTDNRTPLSVAIWNGNIDTVKFLIANNVDLNLVHPEHGPPLHIAVKMNNAAIVELLMKTKRVNLSALGNKLSAAQYAVRANKFAALTAIIDNRGDEQFYNADGHSILQFAAVAGTLETVKLLIDRDFKFATITNAVSYSLHFIVMFGTRSEQPEKIKFLLEYGADTYEKMSLAVFNNVKYHFPAYAERVVSNDPPIVIAILKGLFEEFKVFLDARMNPNTRIFSGTCALLHLVCEVGNVPMAIHLISLGADTRALDNTGRTPFDFSSQEFASQVFNN